MDSPTLCLSCGTIMPPPKRGTRQKDTCLRCRAKEAKRRFTSKVPTTEKAAPRFCLCGEQIDTDDLRVTLCDQCRQLENIFTDRALRPSRVCHDCGTPTYNYRCPDCWASLRKRLDIDEDVYAEEYLCGQ